MSGKQVQKDLFYAERVESAVDRVVNVFKESLITGKLRPGDRLPSETELSRRLSISRGSIREAMKILSAFGLVEIRRGDGTYIAQSDKVSFDPLLFSLILSNANVKELVEFRELMEFAIVRLVIQHATKENMENIETAISEMEELIGNYEDYEPDQIVQSDLDFHKALGKATNNRLVEKVYRFVMDFFTPSLRLTHENQKGGRNALDHHKRIFEALKMGDVEESITAVEGSIVAWKELPHVINNESIS